MNWFPQLSSGGCVQFPIGKKIRWREISNEMESGELILSEDFGAHSVEWHLSYVDLSDGEAQAIRALHSASCGRFGSFGFVDPLVNLLGGSSDLSRPEWQPGQLSLTPGFADPAGTTAAWKLTNPSGADQAFQQTLGFPGSMTACFSFYVRADAPTTMRIQRDSIVESLGVGNAWSRFYLSGPGDSGPVQTTFGLVLGAQQSVCIWGLQVEAQPYPSKYKVSAGPTGIYPRTAFASDELTFRSTGPFTTSCEIDLISLP